MPVAAAVGVAVGQPGKPLSAHAKKVQEAMAAAAAAAQAEGISDTQLILDRMFAARAAVLQPKEAP